MKLGSDQSIVETIADEDQPEIPDRLQQETVDRNMTAWLGGLSELQQDIIKRRFGLGNGETETLEEIGTAVGIPRERVRQLQNAALSQLRKICEEQGFTAEILFH